MKQLFSIFVLVLLSTSSTFADEAPEDAREAELERLVKQAPKLHLKKLLDYNMEKLEAVYQRALKSADDENHRKALEASQKAWLEFFAADGVVAGWNAKGGSYAYPAQVEQRIYQVRVRIYQLSTPFLQGSEAVPRVPNPRAEQAGSEQPATTLESKPEGKKNPKIETRGHSR